MRVALTGTPGVGKTALAAVAARHGWTVVDVRGLAEEAGAVVGHDAADGADVVDVAALARRMRRRGSSGAGRGSALGSALGPTLYEGHLSHLLPLDAAWVVRCDPRVLRGRLAARGYRPEKVRENLEAEALDIVLQEALDRLPRVVQRDGTRRSPAQLFAAFDRAMESPAGPSDLEAVDWSGQLPILLPEGHEGRGGRGGRGKRGPARRAGQGPPRRPGKARPLKGTRGSERRGKRAAGAADAGKAGGKPAKAAKAAKARRVA